MFTHACYSLLMTIFCFIGVDTNIIRLTPIGVYAKENSSATLTCSKTNGALIETRWQNSKTSQVASLLILNGECKVTTFLLDSDLFDGVCNGNGTYSVVLKRIDRSQHGAEWMCREIGSSTSNKAVIYVSVPARTVNLSQPIRDYMTENQIEKITCITSACRPDPRVLWYLRNINGRVVYNLTQFSTYRHVDREYGLKSVESTIYFKPNRTMNGYHLYCEVWTGSDKADITSREILLNITYPPDSYPKIQGFEANNSFQVIESDTGTFVCSITGGNPPPLLSWNCFGSNDVSLKTEVNTVSSTIKWTALRGYSTCSCRAKHLNNWTRITNITVNVQFQSEITKFTLNVSSAEKMVVINQMDNASLVCIAEGNPSSNLTIVSPRGDYISEVSNSNIARHNLWHASYLNAGKYTCRGRNNYTRGLSSSSNLILIVRCPPRHYSGDTSVMRVATLLHVDVTITFSARKFLDEPNKTIFRWFKENERINDNVIKYTIHTEELQTKLSIRNTTQRDLGLYGVNVKNSAGDYVHFYDLMEAGIPDTPKDFRIIDNSVTDSTVTLTWSPGFNGGFQQTFVIIYKMKLETVWLNISIIDDGKALMNCAIYGLSSMQEYEIEMFATNREGFSAHTQRLHFITKASIHKYKESVNSTKTGALVGVGVGTCISTILIVAIVLIGYKRLKKHNFSGVESKKKDDGNENQLSVTEESQAPSVYSVLDGNRKEGNMYDELNLQTLKTSSEQQNLSSQRKGANIEIKHAREVNQDTLEYINIKI